MRDGTGPLSYRRSWGWCWEMKGRGPGIRMGTAKEETPLPAVWFWCRISGSHIEKHCFKSVKLLFRAYSCGANHSRCYRASTCTEGNSAPSSPDSKISAVLSHAFCSFSSTKWRNRIPRLPDTQISSRKPLALWGSSLAHLSPRPVRNPG